MMMVMPMCMASICTYSQPQLGVDFVLVVVCMVVITCMRMRMLLGYPVPVRIVCDAECCKLSGAPSESDNLDEKDEKNGDEGDCECVRLLRSN